MGAGVGVARGVGRQGAAVARRHDSDDGHRGGGEAGHGQPERGVTASMGAAGEAADVRERVAGLDVGDGVLEKVVQVGGHRSGPSSRVRRVTEPREAWAFTDPRLIPRVAAMSASERSR